jgi:DNA-binding CsgD family transcriptional regulator
MSQEELFHSCVGKLYETALEPQVWGAFLDDFCTLIDAASAHCVAWDERADVTIFSASSRWISTGSELTSTNDHHAIFPRRKLVTEPADGKCALFHEQFDERCLSSGEVRQELIADHGQYFTSMTLGVVDGVMLRLSIHRSEGRVPFGAREAVWLERIKPHLQRAARLHIEISRLRLKASIFEHALDALQDAALVVDDDAHLQLTNARADLWLAENGEVRVNSGHLEGLDAELHERLSKAVSAATRGQGGARVSGSVALPHKRSTRNGASRLSSLRVMPLRPNAQLTRTWQRHLALIVVAHAEAPTPLESRELQALFGLTAAEARLAVSLAEGKILQDIAQSAHVSINTAKTQLRNAFEKTGTHRQAELVKLLLSHPRIDGSYHALHHRSARDHPKNHPNE